jgi:hypothetical protein
MGGMIQVAKNLSGAKSHQFVGSSSRESERLGGFGEVAALDCDVLAFVAFNLHEG